MTIWEAGLEQPLIKFLKNPQDLVAIQEIYACYSKDTKVVESIEKRLLARRDFKELFEQWYTPQKFTLDELLKLPENTFGFQYATHMKRNNLSLDFITDLGSENVIGYLWHRAQYVHDITHILAGYDTSFSGELAVKGFELAQYGSASTAGILGAGILSVSALQPDYILPMLDSIIKGYQRGKMFPFIMGVKWDLEWETPIDLLRKKFDLPDIGALKSP